MATCELTSRARMTRMLERRDHDRIPRSDAYWAETIARWQSEGLDGDAETVCRMLGNDVSGVCWTWPVPFPGREEIISEDDRTKVVRGSMGKIERLWKDKSGTPEHITFDCDSRAKWETVYKPALLSSGLSVQIDGAVNAATKADAEQTFSTMRGIESFEAIRQLCGDVISLSAMAEDPDWVRDMSVTYTNLIITDLEAVFDAGGRADAVWLFGDLGYNHGTFFSPSMYRDIIWPDHKRLSDWAHAHGMKFLYHTDGDVRGLIDLFVEAKFDCIQPMEAKAKMDVRQLSPVYGEKLSFFGNIDMTVAGCGNRDELEHEVRTKLEAGMGRRGYAYHSDHSVPDDVSLAQYQRVLELVRQYGQY